MELESSTKKILILHSLQNNSHRGMKKLMENKINILQSQKQVFSLALRQALEVLQMPLQELSQWLKLQVEQNPALELKEMIEEALPLKKNRLQIKEKLVKVP